MDREKITEKLKKIKELAERGVGGEKETALKMYHDLKQKYEIEDAEILEDKRSIHWFAYKTDQDIRLLYAIFGKVTGSDSHYEYTGSYKRRKKRGVECTELEAAEISLLYSFYKAEYEREEHAFWIAFQAKNRLFNDSADSDNNGECEKQRPDDPERKRMLKKAAYYSMLLDGRKPPAAMLEEFEVEE